MELFMCLIRVAQEIKLIGLVNLQGLEERMAANIKKEDYEREDEGDIKAVDVSTGWSSINIPQIPVRIIAPLRWLSFKHNNSTGAK